MLGTVFTKLVSVGRAGIAAECWMFGVKNDLRLLLILAFVPSFCFLNGDGKRVPLVFLPLQQPTVLNFNSI